MLGAPPSFEVTLQGEAIEVRLRCCSYLVAPRNEGHCSVGNEGHLVRISRKGLQAEQSGIVWVETS
jgi:hypothetical protein